MFAQAAVSGGSAQKRDIIEEIVGEAAIMSYLRHPRILQLFGCSLTVQAIWLVSELCSRGSLRQVLDDKGLALTPAQRQALAWFASLCAPALLLLWACAAFRARRLRGCGGAPPPAKLVSEDGAS